MNVVRQSELTIFDWSMYLKVYPKKPTKRKMQSSRQTNALSSLGSMYVTSSEEISITTTPPTSTSPGFSVAKRAIISKGRRDDPNACSKVAKLVLITKSAKLLHRDNVR